MLEKYTFQSFYGNISITMELKLRRKIETVLEKYYETDQGKILLVDGARQTGKSYIIRETAKKAFKNYIEINLFEDKHGSQLFSTVDTVEKFNLTVSLFTGNISDDEAKDTLIFLDEIQEYPQLLPLLWRNYRQGLMAKTADCERSYDDYINMHDICQTERAVLSFIYSRADGLPRWHSLHGPHHQ